MSCNGTLLIRKRAIKADFYNHGLAYRFLPLEAFEEEKICQNGIDLVGVCMTLSFVTTNHVNLQLKILKTKINKKKRKIEKKTTPLS